MNNRIPDYKKRRKRRKTIPWKRIASFSMAVLLVMTVIFSEHLSGVLAEEDAFTAGEMQTAEPEETSATAYSEEDAADASGDLVQFQPDAEETAEEIQVSDTEEMVSDTEQTDAGEIDPEPSDPESGEIEPTDDIQAEDGEGGLQAETESADQNQTEDIIMEENADSNELAMDGSTAAATGTTKDELELFSDDTVTKAAENIKSLIDADVVLLNWKAKGGNDISVTIGETTYNVSDSATYQEAYDALYEQMTSAATVFTETSEENADTTVTEINQQTISTDTIWNITGTVKMTGNVTVQSGARLVILGTGSVEKSGSFSIINNGTTCLQGNIYFNGQKYGGYLLSQNSGEVYLADDFRLGNNANNAVYASGGTFYMLGGLIGSRDIQFDWYNEENQSIGKKITKKLLSISKMA